MIESYDFGSIRIKGKTYSSDLIIFPDHIKLNWWRKEGHSIHLDDLKEVINMKPKVLVIGTGYPGLVKVPEEVKKHLAENGIKVIVQPTKEACKTFNGLLKTGEKVAAALHLTC
jgi:hypothetical protein